MSTTLTGVAINVSYGQLLFVEGGLDSVEKPVRSGLGIISPLKLTTGYMAIDNLRFYGNTVVSTDTNGNINLTPNGSGSVVISNVTFSSPSGARTALALGTLAVQDANSIAVTGGSITGITDLAVADGGTGASTLTGYVKGNGTAAFTAAATIPFADLAGRAYGMFSDTTDQTGSVSAATAVLFGTNEIAGAGVSIVNNGSAQPTRITFTAAGTYMVAPNLQLANSDTTDHDVTIWARLNGTNIARSATKITVPKAGDGGNAFFQLVFYVTVSDGQYVEIMWLPENVAITLDHTSAAAGPPAIPAIPSAIVVAERIA